MAKPDTTYEEFYENREKISVINHRSEDRGRSFLGLEPVENGDILGWGSTFFETGFAWLDFENRLSRLEDGLECIIVSTLYLPELI